MDESQNLKFAPFFVTVSSQYAPSFQNAKVDQKSKAIVSIFDDYAILTPNFVGVVQKDDDRCAS